LLGPGQVPRSRVRGIGGEKKPDSKKALVLAVKRPLEGQTNNLTGSKIGSGRGTGQNEILKKQLEASVGGGAGNKPGEGDKHKKNVVARKPSVICRKTRDGG